MKCEGRWHDNRASGACYREATQEVDGKQLCGQHAAGSRRSKKARAAWEAKYRAKQVVADDLHMRASRLSAALGVRVDPHYSAFGEGPYDGRMVVPVEFLETVARLGWGAGD